MKRCTNCKRVLELCEFPRDRGRTYPKCLSCKRAQFWNAYHRRRSLHRVPS